MLRQSLQELHEEGLDVHADCVAATQTLSPLLQPVVAHWQKLVTPGICAKLSADDRAIDVSNVIFAALPIIDGVQ
jgi:hypothetical protein